MYSISINDQFLDLGKTALTITMINPIFDRDSILRVFSFPFNLDATARNKHIFQHADRLDKVAEVEKYTAKLYLGKNLFELGVLSLLNTTERTFRIVFKNQILELIDQLKSIKLRELSLVQDIGYIYTPTYLLTIFWPIPLGSFQFYTLQIDEHVFVETIGNHQAFLDQINEVFPDSASIVASSVNTLDILFKSPSPETELTLNVNVDPNTHVFFSQTPLDNDLNAETHQQYWQDHLTDIIENPTTHVFPVVFNNSFFAGKEEFAVSKKGNLNHYHENGTYSINTQRTANKTWDYSLIPFTYTQTILDALIPLTQINSYDGDFYQDPEIQQLVLSSNRSLDYLISNSSYTLNPTDWLNIWLGQYNLADHFPDVTAHEFLFDISSTFCLLYDFKEGRFQMETCKSRLLSPVEDWTHLAEQGYKQTYKEKQNYCLDYDRQDDQTTVDGQLEKVGDGKDATEFISNFYTYFDIVRNDYSMGFRRWRLPMINEVGTVNEIGQQNDLSKRLLFYRGMQPDYIELLYPFASAYTQDTRGNEIANYSLDWQGEKGLYNQWWKEYIELITKGKPVTKNLRLTINQILELKAFEQIRKRIWHRKGQIQGVVKQVQFKAYPDREELSISKVDFITQ